MNAIRSNDAKGPAASPALFAPHPVASPPEQKRAYRMPQWRVLACLDDSAFSDSVLGEALAVARGLDLPVTAARVIETPRHLNTPADPLEWQFRRREGLSRLDQAIAPRAREAAGIDSVLLAGPVADELTGWAKTHGVTLMALGTHERPDDRPSLGMTAQRVLERAPASLLLVPSLRSASPRPAYRRVLVPLDGSCRAESVLPIAVRIVRAHGAELILAHVVPRAEIVGAGPVEPQGVELCAQLARHNEQSAREYLDGLQAQLWKERLPVRAIIAADGDPRAQLCRLAIEQHADLIIVSSHGRSGMTDVACGSVTEYLANHTPAPLLIVRPNFAHVFVGSPVSDTPGVRSPSSETA